MNAPDVHLQIQALRDSFAERVRLELMELDDLLATPMVGVAGLQRARSVLQTLHNIAGDSRTLGLYRLRQEARVLEQALQPVVDAGKIGDETFRAQLGSTFAEHVRALGGLLETDLLSRVPNSVLEAYHTPKTVYRRPQSVEPERLDQPEQPEQEPETPPRERAEPETLETDFSEAGTVDSEMLESEAPEAPEASEPTRPEPGNPEPAETEPEILKYDVSDYDLAADQLEADLSANDLADHDQVSHDFANPDLPDVDLADYELLAPGIWDTEMQELQEPQVSPSDEESRAPVSEEKRSQPTIPLVEPSWVVLLEPDVETAEHLMAGLQRNGYEVLWVTDMSGLEAFANQAGTETPVSVVADIVFSQALADAPFMRTNAFLPVIYLSDVDTFQLRYKLAKSRAGGFFVRPIEVPQLVERIERQMAEVDEVQHGRVLVIADEPEGAEHCRAVLGASGFHVSAINDPEECFAALAQFRPDLVVMDTDAGPYAGEILTRTLRQQREWQDLPIIQLVSSQTRDNRLTAPLDGLDELVAKPVSDRQLVNSVRAQCARTRRMNRLLSRDSLTGVMNHQSIKQALNDELARVRRKSHNAVAALVDLDDLQEVNATYGHPQGDRVIRTLANTLSRRLRRTDRVGRYNGQEFVVVLPDCDELDAWSVLDDVRRHFSNLVFRCDGGSFRVTLSVGLVQLGDFPSADAVLLSADRALHSRKAAGKDGVAVFN
ncbi:hypothetical protein RE428_46500 [Marinobacter nanhaiticus D15-8W]|uniref:diguanylate cyclase n=1 Tax=Marinobacter nanhaiticus D15-8W TaxID=626887 RepID=N6X365_9GAMM|nr:diguanylate cyclase [Marinobacter nanhaiticus]ENO15518.1 diguanylate cyclase response regulator [Marinobacter nanhaiticus D15-8W]BES73632.1 hypothetical protein RE428_46500 [Marinobacter nanhaiticus D15-8W]